MNELLLKNGDGELTPLSNSSSHIRGVLRWLASRGDPELTALCLPLAAKVDLEEKASARETRKAAAVAKAREGESQYGEPVVILQPGKLFINEVRRGEEISLAEVDFLAGFKYCAAQMALQRAKKDGTFIAVLLKGTEEEIKFCRVSDFCRVTDQFPGVAELWERRKGEK